MRSVTSTIDVLHRFAQRNKVRSLRGLVVLALSLHSARAEMTEVWVRRYDNVVNNAQDEAIQMALDPQGNVVVVGSSQTGPAPGLIVTVKYSADLGSALWNDATSNQAIALLEPWP
jgi:hypothetical protein